MENKIKEQGIKIKELEITRQMTDMILSLLHCPEFNKPDRNGKLPGSSLGNLQWIAGLPEPKSNEIAFQEIKN